MPAVLGLRDPDATHAALERVVGRPVFEIPTLPPSVPGLRLEARLRALLRAARGRSITGSEVVGHEPDGTGATAVRLRVSGGERVVRTRWVVLATGGVASGGIVLGPDGVALETALGLPLGGVPAPGERAFAPGFFDSHPLSRAGMVVDEGLRACGPDGARLGERLLVAGATLAGAEPWKEGSGNGLALASGHRAAELILAEGAAASPVTAVVEEVA